MIYLNSTTKQAQLFINAYKRATATELEEVYKSCSARKKRAFSRWRTQAASDERYVLASFRITGASGYFFSLGFLTEEEGGRVLHYITPTKEYVIDYD